MFRALVRGCVPSSSAALAEDNAEEAAKGSLDQMQMTVGKGMNKSDGQPEFMAGGSIVSGKRPQPPSFEEPPNKIPCKQAGETLQFFVEVPLHGKRTLVVRKSASASVQSVIEQVSQSVEDMGLPPKCCEFMRLTFRNGKRLANSESLQSAGVSDGVTLYMEGKVLRNTQLIQKEMDCLNSLADEMMAVSLSLGKESETEAGRRALMAELEALSMDFRQSASKFVKVDMTGQGFYFSTEVAQIFLAKKGLDLLASISRVEEALKGQRTTLHSFVTELANACTVQPSIAYLGKHGAIIILAMLKEWSAAPKDGQLYELLLFLIDPITTALCSLLKDESFTSLGTWFNQAPQELAVDFWGLIDLHFPKKCFAVPDELASLVVHKMCKGLRILFQGAQAMEASEQSPWKRIYHSLHADVDFLLSTKFAGTVEQASPLVMKITACVLTLMETLSAPHEQFKEVSNLPKFRAFWCFLEGHKGSVNALLCSQSGDFVGFKELPWLLKEPYRELLTLDTKRSWLEYNLPDTASADSDPVELVVDRDKLLADAFDKLAYEQAADLRDGGIAPTFANEEGYGPGVRREFFVAVARELFDPANALFVCSPQDRRLVFPNQASNCHPGHLSYFKFCGRFLALALAHRVQLGVAFAPALFRLLCDVSADVSKDLDRLDDVADIDQDTWRSCKQLLQMTAEEVSLLGLTFVCCMEKLGAQIEMPLLPAGEDKEVTASNLRHFLELKLRKQLYEPVRCQVTALREGFQEMLVQEAATLAGVLQPIGEKDFALILRGDPADLSLDDWKAHTSYHDYRETDVQIKWFWTVVESLPQERRRQLLFFATSVKYLPPAGFKGLPDCFHIFRGGDDVNLLPTSHTCFLQLVLPPYESYEMMHRRLMIISSAEVAESFGNT